MCLCVCVCHRSQREVVDESARADATNEKFAHYIESTKFIRLRKSTEGLSRRKHIHSVSGSLSLMIWHMLHPYSSEISLSLFVRCE